MGFRQGHFHVLEADAVRSGSGIEKRQPAHESDLIEGGRSSEDEAIGIGSGIVVGIRRNSGQFPGDGMAIALKQSDGKRKIIRGCVPARSVGFGSARRSHGISRGSG